MTSMLTSSCWKWLEANDFHYVVFYYSKQNHHQETGAWGVRRRRAANELHSNNCGLNFIIYLVNQKNGSLDN